MPQARVYITYSDLFDRRPNSEELYALLKSLNAFNTVVLLSRMNTMLRQAGVSQNKQDSGAFQRWFAMAFLNEETKQRIEARFGRQNAELRPICHPLQLLNIIKLAPTLCEGGEDARPDTSDKHRHDLGTTCLMMNDLFVTPKEVEDISTGLHDDRRRWLMVQSLAQIELGNPADFRHMILRSFAMYGIALQDPILLARIKTECGGLDIEKEFEELTGMPLMSYVSLCFGIHTSLAFHTQDEYLNKPDICILNRKNFVAEPAISQRHIDIFFDLLSVDFDELRIEMQKDRPVDSRLDVVPFKSKPLLKTAEDNYICVDFSFVTQKMHDGPYFLLANLLPKEDRWRIHNAWGLVFEHYVNWLLKPLDGQEGAILYPDTFWVDGERAFDSVLLRKKVVVLFEYKGGLLRQDARYSSDMTTFMKDFDRKISEGCMQLARDISSLFPERGDGRKLKEVPVPSDAFCVMPVLIVQDAMLKTPFVNYFLNQQFQIERERYRSNPNIKVLPINMIQVTQLESLVEMAESFNLDLISTLHKRCNMDPVMGVDLQDFMTQAIPESKQPRCSRRFGETMKSSEKQLCQILFGPQYEPKDTMELAG